MPISKIDELVRDMLLRQSRIVYPEVEEWVLNVGIDAYEHSLHPKEEDQLIQN